MFSSRLNAQRYKKPYSSLISAKNKQERVQYGYQHQDKGIKSFWSYVYFTDEAHFSSKELAHKTEYELRQPGQEIRYSRIQEA